jgi:pyruvate ferredoxin oxidoreductase beta subunit
MAKKVTIQVLADLAQEREEKYHSHNPLAPGHRMCIGCGIPPIVNEVLLAIDKPVVVANATGCLEVTTGVYPLTSWNTPWIHVNFESTGAVIGGVEAGYKVLKKKGLIDEDIEFVAFGGDGGTYDIGFQSLSAAVERGHNFLYVCYNNEGYQNTGYQKSSATPIGAYTKTTPVGSAKVGKQEARKDLTMIMAAHGIPYVAQASPHIYRDLTRKVKKALIFKGPKFINTLQPCTLSWRFAPEDTMRLAKLAVETRYWPVYEVINGKYWKVNIKPKRPKPIEEYISAQPRWKHVLKYPEIVERIQKEIDDKWNHLLALEEMSKVLAEKEGIDYEALFANPEDNKESQ